MVKKMSCCIESCKICIVRLSSKKNGEKCSVKKRFCKVILFGSLMDNVEGQR